MGHRKPARIQFKANAPKTSNCIIQPFLFENAQGEAVTVNGDRYRAMLNEFLFTKIEENDIGNICFQQDGATYHTAETIDALEDNICEAIDEIQLHTFDTAWPAEAAI